jgi:predicted nucleic acid-binding protein
MMPKRTPVFVDTSGWIALLNKDDSLHDCAASIMRNLAVEQRRLITTDWILAETSNSVARTAARHSFPVFVNTFLNSPHAQLIRVSSDCFRQALEIYEQASDKSWGLVDCASFVVMQSKRSVDAFSADRHFEQFGFHCLLPTAI